MSEIKNKLDGLVTTADVNRVFDTRIIAFNQLAAFEDESLDVSKQLEQYRDQKTGQMIQCQAAMDIQTRLKDRQLIGNGLSRAYTLCNYEVDRIITLVRLQSCQ